MPHICQPGDAPTALQGVGQHARATALAEEAVGYARRLDEPATLAAALLDAGISVWGVPERRTEAFVHFDEALDVLRGLVAEHGPAEYGPTFLRWVHWPIGEMLRLDGQHARATALAEEAQTYTTSLRRRGRVPLQRWHTPLMMCLVARSPGPGGRWPAAWPRRIVTGGGARPQPSDVAALDHQVRQQYGFHPS